MSDIPSNENSLVLRNIAILNKKFIESLQKKDVWDGFREALQYQCDIINKKKL